MTLRGFTSRSIWTDRIAAERKLVTRVPHVPGEHGQPERWVLPDGSASEERHSRPRNLTVASIAPKSEGVAK
jgi:hypothetical protein